MAEEVKPYMRRGMRVVSWVLALTGTWALWQAVGPWAVIGVILLIWANNVYEATRS